MDKNRTAGAKRELKLATTRVRSFWRVDNSQPLFIVLDLFFSM